jgi:hypothetical protein
VVLFHIQRATINCSDRNRNDIVSTTNCQQTNQEQNIPNALFMYVFVLLSFFLVHLRRVWSLLLKATAIQWKRSIFMNLSTFGREFSTKEGVLIPGGKRGPIIFFGWVRVLQLPNTSPPPRTFKIWCVCFFFL